MLPRIPIVAGSCLPVWLFTLPATAQSPTSLSYAAPADCGSQADFEAAVRDRGGRFDADRAAAPRELEVVIREEEGGFVGTLALTTDDDASEPREVHGASCQDVIDALAVVTAIALRPDPEAGADAATDANAPPPRSFSGTHHWGHESVPVGRGTLRYDPQFALTLYVGAALGPVPNVYVPRLDVAFHLANFTTTPDGKQRLIGPILRARASLSMPPEATFERGDTTVRIGTQSLGLGACWSPHYDSRGLVLLGCAELGVTFMGFAIETPDTPRRDEHVVFGTIGPVLEAQYHFGRRFHLGAKAGVDAVIGDFSVQDADGTPLFESWHASAYGMIGGGVHF